MKKEIKIVAYSGAISADYEAGADYDNDCYSQWIHPEYIFRSTEKELIDEVKNFIVNELSGSLEQDNIIIDDEVIVITTLVNDSNTRPSFGEFRNWIKNTGSMWVKDTSIEVYVNDEIISLTEDEFFNYQK